MRSGAPRVKAGAGHAARASETLRLGIASHGAALAGPGADSRSEPRHKTLAGLKMLIAGLGQQRRSEPREPPYQSPRGA